MIDLNQAFSIKPLELKISVLAENYDQNNGQNCYDTENRIVLKLSKIFEIIKDPTFC